MSDARSDILGAVKAALKQAGGAGKADTTTVVSASQRLGNPRANLIPARAEGRLKDEIVPMCCASFSVSQASSLPTNG